MLSVMCIKLRLKQKKKSKKSISANLEILGAMANGRETGQTNQTNGRQK